jgi:hypothetical protein
MQSVAGKAGVDYIVKRRAELQLPEIKERTFSDIMFPHRVKE